MNNKKIDEVIKEVENGLVTFIKEGKYKEILMSMSNLGKYSLNNQLYILMQRGDAKTVYGIRSWNKFGRHIKRNEKAIKIYSPIIKEKLDDKDNKEMILVGYRTSNVFDISQTEGKEFDVFKFDEKKTVDNKDLIIKSIINTLKTIDFNCNYVSKEVLGDDCFGLCNHKTNQIYLRDDLSPLQEISTLIHETGHAFAHSNKRDDLKELSKTEKREIKEIEAESIACIVCTYLGLDTKNFNFSYITAWSKNNILKFKNNLDKIRYYASLIIDKIDSNMKEIEDAKFCEE